MSIDRDLSIQPRESGKPSVQSGSWDGFSVECVDVSGVGPYDFSRSGESIYLALHDIVLSDGEVEIDGGEKSTLRDLRQTVTLMPPRTKVSGWSSVSNSPSSFIALYYDPAALSTALDDLYKSAPDPILYGRDPALITTLRRLGAVVQEGGDALYAEQLAILAAIEATGLRKASLEMKGMLSPRQLTAAKDFMRDNHAADIGLGDLANATGLSKHHFARAFGKSTGMSPYRYLTDVRVGRAVDLLMTTTLPVAEVARRTGFKDDGNLRRAFYQIMGVGPRELRKKRS